MQSQILKRDERRSRREMRVRKRLRGTAEKPRLTVFKSNRYLSVQLIDDELGHTIIGMSSKGHQVDGSAAKKGKAIARYLGELLAAKALEKKIQAVVFDRGHRKYHGVLAELADGARAQGLQF